MNDNDDLIGMVDFLLELGRLKRLPRAGWLLAGVSNVETVAEHSYRTAIVGYQLALLEKCDEKKVLLMCLLHDVPETRLGDMDIIARDYIDKSPVLEHRVSQDQISRLPQSIYASFSDTFDALFVGSSLERKIVKDADKLECYLQAVEYRCFGANSLDPFFKIDEDEFHTESGKKLYTQIASAELSGKDILTSIFIRK